MSWNNIRSILRAVHCTFCTLCTKVGSIGREGLTAFGNTLAIFTESCVGYKNNPKHDTFSANFGGFISILYQALSFLCPVPNVSYLRAHHSLRHCFLWDISHKFKSYLTGPSAYPNHSLLLLQSLSCSFNHSLLLLQSISPAPSITLSCSFNYSLLLLQSLSPAPSITLSCSFNHSPSLFS